MKLQKIVLLGGTVFAAACGFGSGFALYEPSTFSTAMGGALVGRGFDGSANYNNPATLSDITNNLITIGFVTEHPRGQTRGTCNGRRWGDECEDAGLFWLPHFGLSVPLPADFTFGLSAGVEYGLGTKYGDHWPMAWSSTETTVQGYVLNPNLAYRITKDWSVGVGLRWLYFDFEQYSAPSANGLGTLSTRLKGDNRFLSVGFQVGTKYDISDDFSVGAVYKSPIKVKVKGKIETSVDSYNEAAIGQYAGLLAQSALGEAGFLPDMPGYSAAFNQALGVASGTVRSGIDAAAAAHNGAAEAELTLPQSISLGCNWDVTSDWHLGAAISWTQWSIFDSLHFDLAGGDTDTQLEWQDTWRLSVGSSWAFADDWKWMISYVFDMDSTTSDQQSTMLPPAHRHIASTGFAWNCWGGFELAASYSCIFMDGRGMNCNDSLGNYYHLETCRGFCHAVGFSLTYRF